MPPPTQPTISHPPSDLSQYDERQDNYWWKCRFKVAWDQDKLPDLSVDLLLAHAIVKPVLDNHRNSIGFWRFHRRAGRDSAGHQFTFLFYSNISAAEKIFEDINSSQLICDALNSGILSGVHTDTIKSPKDPNLEDTSDRNWPQSVQENWPAFIMGASDFWLRLIDSSLPTEASIDKSISSLLDDYRHADKKVSQIWKFEGQHALLPHLNAIFGYKPIHIKKNIWF